MKYLFPCLLMLPLMTSCVPDDPYYRPAPRVEVYPGRPNQHYHHDNSYRAAPARGTYHGHAATVQPVPPPRVQAQPNTHGHNGSPPPARSGRAAPAAAVVVKPRTVHGHEDQDESNVHGHH